MAVSSPDLKAFLLATPFFGGLSDASLDLLVSMLVERYFDAGVSAAPTVALPSLFARVNEQGRAHAGREAAGDVVDGLKFRGER